MGGGGLTAAGLIVLLLALIGIGVGIYYAYICLRARPVRSRQHTDCEEGPLIADPDVNGNHDDIPLEASAPVEDESDSKTKVLPDEIDGDEKRKHVPPESNGPVDEVAGRPPKEKEEVLVPIEVRAEPAKLIHESETAQVLNHIAPVGFVAPIVHFQKDGTFIPQESPKRAESVKLEKAEPEAHHPITSPVPVFVPVSGVGKKPVTDSDEEDGLLLQKCAPQDDSLEQESCSELSTPSKEEMPIESEALPAINYEQKEAAAESIPEKLDSMKPDEKLDDLPDDTQPSKPLVTAAITPDYGWKKEDPHSEISLDSAPEEVSIDKHQPMIMKEEVENLQPIEVSKLVAENEEPVCIAQDVDKILETPQKVDDQLVKEAETLLEAAPEVNIPHPTREAEYPEVVYLETSKPYPGEKESESSESSDEQSSSHIEPPSDACDNLECISDKDPAVDVKGEEQNVNQSVLSVPEAAIEAEPQKLHSDPSTMNFESDSDDASEVSDDSSLKDHVEITEDDDLSVIPSPDIQNENAELLVTSVEPAVESDAPAGNVVLAIEVSEDVQEVSDDVPLEAEGSYYTDPVDDVNTLAIIREEGSMDAESDNTDTDTSEPEITQYTFSKESPATSTTNILADEISTTLEPEVTKYSVIPELEGLAKSEDNSQNPVKVTSQFPKVAEVEASPLTSNGNTAIAGDEEVFIPSKTPDQSTTIVSDAEEIKADSVELEKLPSLQIPEIQVVSSESETSDSEGEKAEPDTKEEIVLVLPVTHNQSKDTASTDTVSSNAKKTPEVSSESESGGEEAEPAIKKEVILVPSVTQNQSKVANPDTVSSTPAAEENKTEIPVVQMADLNKSCSDKIPQVTIVSIPKSTVDSSPNSSSLSPSSESDLSDDELAPSSPAKSKIPKLVERHGS